MLQELALPSQLYQASSHEPYADLHSSEPSPKSTPHAAISSDLPDLLPTHAYMTQNSIAQSMSNALFTISEFLDHDLYARNPIWNIVQ